MNEQIPIDTSNSTQQKQTGRMPNNKSAEIESRSKVFLDGFQFKEFSALLAFAIPLVFLVFGLIEGFGRLWKPLAAVLYIVLVIIGIVWLFGVIMIKETYYQNDPEFGISFVVVAVLCVLVGFSQISRYLYLGFGGFSASQTGYWHWLRFGISNMLESVLFDIPAIYEWNITEVRATAFWSKTLVFILRTSIEFLVIAELLRAVSVARKSWVKLTASQHKHYIGFMFSKLGWLFVLGLWSIPLAFSVGAIANDGLSYKSAIIGFKYGCPVIFGSWFAWHSLFSFFTIGGKWSKLLALIGIGFGIWLVRENWPMLVSFVGFR